MSIILKGIDMPKEGEHIVTLIKSNGKCTYWKQDTEYGICEPMQTVEAIPIPTPHGRLIEEEQILSPIMCRPKSLRLDDNAQYNIITLIADAPTILEAER